MKIIIITGPPFCGKGTQCEILEQYLHFKHISTGDRIRREKQQQTDMGLAMNAYEADGSLVPDSIMKTLLHTILNECAAVPGIILDGYPRTKEQVIALQELLHERELQVSLVINLDVPQEELVQRAHKRAATSQREDDQNPEVHLKRIAVFNAVTRPAIAYMQQLWPVETVTEPGGIAETAANIKTIVHRYI